MKEIPINEIVLFTNYYLHKNYAFKLGSTGYVRARIIGINNENN